MCPAEAVTLAIHSPDDFAAGRKGPPFLTENFQMLSFGEKFAF